MGLDVVGKKNSYEGGPSFFNDFPDVHLEILRGRAKFRQRPVIAPVYLIGSAKDCDLVLGDLQFPELHTYLFVTRDGVVARHLGEGPDLRIRNQVVQSATLNDGDHLVTGSYDFVIRIKPAAESEASYEPVNRLNVFLPTANPKSRPLPLRNPLVDSIRQSMASPDDKR